MISGKLLGRRLPSPATPAAGKPPEDRLPRPPYIRPTKGSMQPRLKKGDTQPRHVTITARYLRFKEYDGTVETESLLQARDTDTQQTPLSRPSSRPILREYGDDDDDDDEDKSQDFSSRSTTPVASLRSQVTVLATDRPWLHSVTAWQIMRLALRCEYELASVAHVCRDTNESFSSSGVQNPCTTLPMPQRFTGRVLAAYGLPQMSDLLRSSLDESIRDKQTGYRAETLRPDGLYGQVYTFDSSTYSKRKSNVHVHPCFGLAKPFERINWDIVFVVYRRGMNGTKLTKEAAELFVNSIIDLYSYPEY